MARALYIRPNDVFKNTFIQADVDPDKIVPFIESAQDIFVQNLIGETLYNRFDQLIYDARQTVPVTANGNIDQPAFSAYKDLVTNHLQGITEQYAAMMYLRYGGFTASNKGIFKHEANNATAATTAEVNQMARQIQERAEFYAERMYDFICRNTELFPEWTDTQGSDLPPSHQQYQYGFITF